MDLNDYIKKIEQKKTHPIVFISGLGGSGKTTLAQKLVAENLNAKYFTLDWYHINTSQKRAKRTKEALSSNDPKLIDKELNPINWFDYELFTKDILNFQKTGKFEIKNTWNQGSGNMEDNFKFDFEGKKGLIICDGLYLLHPDIVKLADLSIFIDISKEEARDRAAKRDNTNRPEEYLAIKKMIVEKYDMPYFDKYKKNADLILKETL